VEHPKSSGVLIVIDFEELGIPLVCQRKKGKSGLMPLPLLICRKMRGGYEETSPENSYKKIVRQEGKG